MKILCAGEMMVDLMVGPVDQVSFENDTKLIGDIRISSGGDANNNAVDLVKLGHSVIYLGRIGCDEMGEYVVRAAEQAGVDMRYAVRSASAPQAKSLILRNEQGDRTFLQCAGSSAEFCFEDCDLSLLEQADLLQISGTFHLPAFDGAGAAKLLCAARRSGVITSMDITTDRSGRWKGILDPCYPYLDYFLPSIEQASMIAGTDDPACVAGYFLERGVGNVAVKLGEKGCYFQNAEEAFYAGIFHGLNVVETTGAGDAFCAGFLTGVGRKAPPRECVALATACSSFAIQAAGATAGMRDLQTIERFLMENPPLEFRTIF